MSVRIKLSDGREVSSSESFDAVVARLTAAKGKPHEVVTLGSHSTGGQQAAGLAETRGLAGAMSALHVVPSSISWAEVTDGARTQRISM